MKRLLLFAFLTAIDPLGAMPYGAERAVSAPGVVPDQHPGYVRSVRSASVGTRVATAWWTYRKYLNSEVYLRVIDASIVSAPMERQFFVGYGANPLVATNGNEFGVAYYDGRSIAFRRFDLDGHPLSEPVKIADAARFTTHLGPQYPELLSMLFAGSSAERGRWIVVWSETYYSMRFVHRVRRAEIDAFTRSAGSAETLISGISVLDIAQGPESLAIGWNDANGRTYVGIWAALQIERIIAIPLSARVAALTWNGASFSFAFASGDGLFLADAADPPREGVRVGSDAATIVDLAIHWNGFEHTLAALRRSSSSATEISVDSMTLDGRATRMPHRFQTPVPASSIDVAWIENALTVSHGGNGADGTPSVSVAVLRNGSTDTRLLSESAEKQSFPFIHSDGTGRSVVVWRENRAVLGRQHDGAIRRLSGAESIEYFRATAFAEHVYAAWIFRSPTGGSRLQLSEWNLATNAVRSSSTDIAEGIEVDGIVADAAGAVILLRRNSTIQLFRAALESLQTELWHSEDVGGVFQSELERTDCCTWIVQNIGLAFNVIVLDNHDRVPPHRGIVSIGEPLGDTALAPEGNEIVVCWTVRANQQPIRFARLNRDLEPGGIATLGEFGDAFLVGLTLVHRTGGIAAMWGEHPDVLPGELSRSPVDWNLVIRRMALDDPVSQETTVIQRVPDLPFDIALDGRGESIVYSRRIPALGFGPRLFYRLPAERARGARR